MRRTLEQWLILLLLFIWAMCFVASAVALHRGIGFPPFFIGAPASAGGAPAVTAFRPTLLGGTSGDLQIGDRIVRVGSLNVRGDGPVSFFVRFIAASRDGGPLAVEYERDGVGRMTTILPGSTRLFWPLLLSSPVFAIVAFLLWRTAGNNPAAYAFVCALGAEAFYLVGFFPGAPLATWATIALHTVMLILIGPLIVRAFLLFPDRARLTPGERRWPWLLAILGPLHTAHIGAPVPPRVGAMGATAVVIATQVVCVLAATRAYRRADPIGRRRLKWVLFGTYCSIVPPISTGVLAAIDPAFLNLYFVSLAAIACLPIALLIAIARVNLFDIDRLLSTAGSYNLLIAAAVVIGVTVVPRAAQAGAELLGLDSGVGQLGLSGMLGLAIYYAHRHLRPRIERLFFLERHTLDSGVHDLLGRIRQSPDVETLVGEITATLGRLVRPETCTVFARGDGSYVPLIAEGPAAPAALAIDGPLITMLRGRREPLALDRGRRRGLDAFERAALVTLGAEVVLPVRRGDELELLLCLGSKRSGDVYTRTDVRLLAMVGETASLRLEHFAQSEVIAQMQRMRDTLRRYVSAPLAEALGQGNDLEPVERDVTVLFVDLRGYTAICEPLPPAEVFALTNAYAAVVSAVLRRHRGNLVEFSGDGLMAVFGAPEPLPHKESAAVHAARELVAALHADGPRHPDGSPLSVGVGIATGRAHCGNIRSADQVIWTAIGNIVNLAARLQALTREIDATIAIDVDTFRLAGSITDDFRRQDEVRIRGRREPEVIYLLSIVPAVAAPDARAAVVAATA